MILPISASEEHSYAIRLTYNPRKNFQNNDIHRYFWGQSDDDEQCVDGQLLNLPNVQNRLGCHFATIISGSSDNIFNQVNFNKMQRVPALYMSAGK